jgi:hypothetical protein
MRSISSVEDSKLRRVKASDMLYVSAFVSAMCERIAASSMACSSAALRPVLNAAQFGHVVFETAMEAVVDLRSAPSCLRPDVRRQI